LKRSSKAFRALGEEDDPDDEPEDDEGEDEVFVSRSTVVRGSKKVQELRASFGEIRAGIGF
jgi:hypothetical protein